MKDALDTSSNAEASIMEDRTSTGYFMPEQCHRFSVSLCEGLIRGILTTNNNESRIIFPADYPLPLAKLLLSVLSLKQEKNSPS